MLTRDQILSLVTKPKKVKVAHLGDAYVRLLSEDEADEVSGKPRAFFVCKVLCDEKGKRLFNDEEGGLVKKKLPYATLGDIFEEGLLYNGMEKAESNGEPEKN